MAKEAKEQNQLTNIVSVYVGHHQVLPRHTSFVKVSVCTYI
jgi:hypothetical protein